MARVLQHSIEFPHPCAYLPQQQASLEVQVALDVSPEDLDALLNCLLESLERHFDIRHAMVLMLDAAGNRLYPVASRGYPASGAGADGGGDAPRRCSTAWPRRT